MMSPWHCFPFLMITPTFAIATTWPRTQKHQAELDAMAQSFRAEMDARRRYYEEQAAEKIAADMNRVAIMLGQAISTEAAAILAPIMTETLTSGLGSSTP